MRIIKRTSDNLVVFASNNLKLTSEGASGDDWETTVVTDSDHTLETVKDLPAGFVPGNWTYSGGTWLRTESEEVRRLQAAKEIKIQQLNKDHDNAIYADIVYNGTTYAADEYAQNLLVKVLAVGSVPLNMYWRDKDKKQKTVTISDLRGLASAILERTLNADSNLISKLSSVNNSLTIADVNNVKW